MATPKPLVICIVFLFSTFLSSFAFSYHFLAESVENFTGCQCPGPNLNYCNDQASGFVSRMNNHSQWDEDYWYTDSNAWGNDFVEDEMQYSGYWGEDYAYADNVSRIAFVSGHGNLYSENGQQRFQGELCKGNSCFFGTSAMKLGEESGPFSSPYPGTLKYMVISMCNSVQVSYGWAHQEWDPVNDIDVADYHMTFGFHNAPDDSPYTVDEGYDFADKANFAGWTLKNSWFYAIDGGTSETAAIITWGSTGSDASNRMNQEKFFTGSYRMMVNPTSALYYVIVSHTAS